HRLRACMELDIVPTFQEWTGEGSLAEHVAALNTGRRHLTSAQRTAAAVELMPLLQEEAKERQREHGGTAPGRGKKSPPENSPGVFQGEAREHAAHICGTNPHSVSDLMKVKKEKPELFEKVKSGDMSVNAAVNALKPSQKSSPKSKKGGAAA